MSTVSESPTRSAALPTVRGRQAQAAIDAAARTMIAPKRILTTTIEAMVREWAPPFRDEVGERAKPVTQHGLSTRERAYQSAAAHWHTYKHRLAEMISVSQLAMVNDDFAQYWSEICAIPTSFITETVRRAQSEGYCADEDPQLIAVAIVAMLNQFCYHQLTGTPSGAEPDYEACIATLANIFYRASYHQEGH